MCKTGVLTAKCETKLDHDVLAVGSGTILVCKTGVSAAKCETKLDHNVLAVGPCTILVCKTGVLTATCGTGRVMTVDLGADSPLGVSRFAGRRWDPDSRIKSSTVPLFLVFPLSVHLNVCWALNTDNMFVELATVRGCHTTVAVCMSSLLVLFSTTGGLVPHDQTLPKNRPGGEGASSQSRAGIPKRPLLSNCCIMTSGWTGIGTDTITTDGHRPSTPRSRRVGTLVCMVPLTTSFGTVGQWDTVTGQ